MTSKPKQQKPSQPTAERFQPPPRTPFTCPCEHGKLNQSQVASTGAGLWREGHGASNSSSRTATILSLIAGPPPSTAPAGLACPLCLLWPNLGRA